MSEDWGGQPLTVVLRGGGSRVEVTNPAADESEVAVVGTGGDPREPLPLRVMRGAREQPFSVNAALGAARVLLDHGVVTSAEPVRLALPLGDVGVMPAAATEPLWLRSPTITLGRAWSSAQVLALLGLQPQQGSPGLPVQLTAMGQPILLVPVADLTALSACRLDGAAFRGYAVRQVRHQALRMLVCVFCRQARQPEHQLAVRLFRPSEADARDAAHGDATACLGAYLLQHGLLTDSGQTLVEQGHELGRPSLLRVRTAAGGGIEVGGTVRPAPTACPTCAP